MANRMLSRVLLRRCLSSSSSLMMTTTRGFHFGSTEYASCFLHLPQPDTQNLRKSALDYIDHFNPKLWYDDPIVTLLKGEKLSPRSGEKPIETINALGTPNGHQILATREDVETIKEYIRTYQSPYMDLREPIRAIERQLLDDEYGALLIGNQCIDFQKQDGITEIEEAIMANTVERRLNDCLLRDEAAGMLTVNRKPIYVSCVSNFTNFLDLFRKTIRSLEVGIPCIILSRSNTSQHSYRWAQLLVELCKQHQVDPGMLTYLSCSLEDIQEITSSCQEFTGNLYATCSRDLAASIKKNYPNTIASTGGPNTLVATELSNSVCEAIRTSATIESSGQCTALRHCVIPRETTDDAIHNVFCTVRHPESAPAAVRENQFDGVFARHTGSAEPSRDEYEHLEKTDTFIRVQEEMPSTNITEYWRKVVVDFTKCNPKEEKTLDQLAKWLNQAQPISLAVNGRRLESIDLALKLFDRTSMVVYTVGSSENNDMPPALTCQARPQEGEIFGEFPPRSSLNDYTKFPVVVPSSNPSYDASYTDTYLKSLKTDQTFSPSAKRMFECIQDGAVHGYCIALIKYLQNVARLNPKQGFGHSRTAVFGLQRPPLNSMTVLRCADRVTWDHVAPIFLIFYVTTARDQIELSIDPANKSMVAFCDEFKLRYIVESSATMEERLSKRSDVFNTLTVDGPMHSFPMAGQFVSLYFPLGHIKSTMADDDEFVFRARLSRKWLNTLF